MSFLTSFRFFFSTGSPAASEALFALLSVGLVSARVFGVLAGVFLEGGLAILVSFLSWRFHRVSLRQRGWRYVNRALGSLSTCVANGSDNRWPYWRTRRQTGSPLPTPRRQIR